MTSSLTRPAPRTVPAHVRPVPARHLFRPRRRVRGRGARLRLGASLAALVVVALAAGALVYRYVTDDSRRDYLGVDGWPSHGQAAVQLGAAAPMIGPSQRPVPIASLAKVMTAYLVLRARPLPPGASGFRLTITPADITLTARQRRQGQSLVRVVAGEVLTERQALMALLLPSANNVAIVLARRVAGSVATFVRLMNVMAQRLGMTRTRYTDPSGFDPATVSTAADQVRLAGVVARDSTLSTMVATRSYRLPAVGTVHNTDVLLGHDGFVGTKTGSDDAAGGCFMFRAYRTIGGRRVRVLGVVLGQPGHDLTLTGQYAARQLVQRLAA